MIQTEIKRYRIPSILILVIFLGFASTDFAFGEVLEGCGLWDISTECDLSGWVNILIGVFAFGIFLGVLLFYFAEKNGKLVKSIIKEQKQHIVITKYLIL